MSLYYKHVYRAEQAILDSKFIDAMAHYDSAFHNSDIPFAIDLYNNSLCCSYCHDYSTLLKMASELIIRGADTSFFNSKPYGAFKKSNEWHQLIGVLQQLKKSRRIDPTLVEKIKLLVAKDQHLHCQLPTSNKAFLDTMHDQDNSLSDSVIHLMNENLYLNEDVLGANFVDTIIKPEPIYYVILLHEFQRNSDKCTQFITNMIQSGYLRSEVGLSLLEMGGRSGIQFLTSFAIFRDTLWANGKTINIDPLLLDSTTFAYKVASKLIERDKIVPIFLPIKDQKLEQLRKEYFVDSLDHVVSKLRYKYCSSQENYFCLPLSVWHEQNSIDDEKIRRKLFPNCICRCNR